MRLTLHEPLEAIELELESQRFRGVIISTPPHRISRWLHQDVPGRLACRHPDLEVTHVISSGHRGGPSRQAAAGVIDSRR